MTRAGFIFAALSTVDTMNATISVKPNTHEQLLKIAGELQGKTGKKVQLDDVIQQLIKEYREQE